MGTGVENIEKNNKHPRFCAQNSVNPLSGALEYGGSGELVIQDCLARRVTL